MTIEEFIKTPEYQMMKRFISRYNIRSQTPEDLLASVIEAMIVKDYIPKYDKNNPNVASFSNYVITFARNYCNVVYKRANTTGGRLS